MADTYYYVENGTIIERRRKPVVNPSLYTDEQGNLDETAFNAAQAARDVYPENVIKPTLEDWEGAGDRVETFNAAESRVDVTWPSPITVDLAKYKQRLIRGTISDAIDNAEYDSREVMWAIADHAVAADVIPNGYRNSILSAEQVLIDSIAAKVQNIRAASTHADAKAAYEAV